MKCTVRMLSTLSLVVLLASPLVAADKQRKGKRGQRNRKPSVARFLPKEIQSTLSDEQKKKIAALDEEFGPKLAELAKKRGSILTPEQKKAEAEARKVARDAGKKRKELQEAVDAALKLTDEQKRQLAELKKESGPLNKTIRDKVLGLLTDDQKAKLPKRGGGKAKGEKRQGKRGKKGGKKK